MRSQRIPFWFTKVSKRSASCDDADDEADGGNDGGNDEHEFGCSPGGWDLSPTKDDVFNRIGAC